MEAAGRLTGHRWRIEVLEEWLFPGDSGLEVGDSGGRVRDSGERMRDSRGEDYHKLHKLWNIY